MKKNLSFIGVMGLVVAFLLAGSVLPSGTQSGDTNNIDVQPSAITEQKEETDLTCDGKNVTTNCTLNEVEYIKYIYHPAEPEKFHTETVVTYRDEVVAYCTLCNDGTYSPSCATGRGACSWHGGVAQWNAPRYRSVPVNTTKKVIDSPAKKAYYEKVIRD